MNNENSATNAAEGLLLGDATQQETPVVPPVQETVAPPVVEQVTPPIKEIQFEDTEQGKPEIKTEAPAFDEAKYLTEKYGTSDINSLKERAVKVEEYERQLAEANEKINSAKPRNKAAEVFDEILSAKGGDMKANKEFIKTALDLLTTDTKELQPLDLIKFKMQMQYPKTTPAAMEAHLKQKYMQGEEFTEEQNLAGKYQMDVDAQDAEISLNELKSKALTAQPDIQAAQNTIQEQKRAAEWKPKVQSIVEGFKTIKLNIGDVNGKKSFLNFDVPADVAKSYTDVVYSSMLAGGDLPNEQTMETAKGVLEALYVRDNLEHITKHIWSKANSESIRKEIETYHNPAIQGKPSGNDVVVQKDKQDMFYEAMGGK